MAKEKENNGQIPDEVPAQEREFASLMKKYKMKAVMVRRGVNMIPLGFLPLSYSF